MDASCHRAVHSPKTSAHRGNLAVFGGVQYAKGPRMCTVSPSWQHQTAALGNCLLAEQCFGQTLLRDAQMLGDVSEDGTQRADPQ
jgi:hypothetical protein